MLPTFHAHCASAAGASLLAQARAAWLLGLSLFVMPPAVALGQEPTVLPTRLDLVPQIALSPDGKLLAANARGRSLNLWDVATAKLVLTFPTDRIQSLCFSPDGKAVLTAQHYSTSRFDPNVQALVSRRVNVVRTWDIATGQEKERWEFSGGGGTVGFTPDGKLLATDAGYTSGAENKDFTVRVWDIAAQKEVAALKGHTGYVSRINCSPDGTLLATAGPELKLWDRRTWLETRLGDKPPKGGTPAFSPDSKLLAIGSQAELTRLAKTVDGRPVPVGPSALNLWDLEKPLEPRPFPRLDFQSHWYACVQFAPDGRTLAAGWNGSRHPQLWDVATGTLLRELKGPAERGHVQQLAFTPAGRRLVIARSDGALWLWNLIKEP